MLKKLSYLNRIFKAYVLKKQSQLSFWHNEPCINKECFQKLDDVSNLHYYMLFKEKANYSGDFDDKGVPMLNYHGTIGLQYNPIAISQYGLAHVNQYLITSDESHLSKVKASADWLVSNLEKKENRPKMWYHYFDFEYFQTLKSPWYSGLAQGQGLSLLIRAYKIFNEKVYLEALEEAVKCFECPFGQGGVVYTDKDGRPWIEEYITNPTTHILNGFIWGWWGLYDYCKWIGRDSIKEITHELLQTLVQKINEFDCGYWSLYDHSQQGMLNVTSLFYHKLHCTQLEIMHRLTSESVFNETKERWVKYLNNSFYKRRAFVHKAIFKIRYF